MFPNVAAAPLGNNLEAVAGFIHHVRPIALAPLGRYCSTRALVGRDLLSLFEEWPAEISPSRLSPLNISLGAYTLRF